MECGNSALKTESKKRQQGKLKTNKEKVSNFRFHFLTRKKWKQEKNCKFQEYNLSILTWGVNFINILRDESFKPKFQEAFLAQIHLNLQTDTIKQYELPRALFTRDILTHNIAIKR